MRPNPDHDWELARDWLRVTRGLELGRDNLARDSEGIPVFEYTRIDFYYGGMDLVGRYLDSIKHISVTGTIET